MTSRSAEETILAQRLPHLLVLDAEILDAFSGKTAHVLTSAVCRFNWVVKSAIELRKLIRDLVVIILTA
jgi:hypothetical protein